MREQSAAPRRDDAAALQLVTADILLQRKAEVDEMIARRAFELFEHRGGGHGHDVDDWMTAELELVRQYRHELKESDSAFVFRAELPCSFTPDHLKLSVEPRRLMVSGERELEVTCGGSVPAHAEKRIQRILSIERLPVDVDPVRTTAKLEGELLEIVMPKVKVVSKPRPKAEAASSGR